ncbi:DNA translocase FtsK [Brevibacillus sp. TJ4]|uniref:DNA translocase FtsK n=1 Tax=Brevibacillus sp. TJ4 TaxID=3234853 RepID=UPI0037CEECE2
MWAWLQKLMSYIRGEEEQRESEDVRPLPASHRQLQAKTKSIFPKEREAARTTYESREERARQFRFPVVPDDYQVKKRAQTANRTDAPAREREAERPMRERKIPEYEPMAKPAAAKEEAARVQDAVAQPVRPPRNPSRFEEQHQQGTQSRRIPPVPASGEKRAYTPSEIVSPVYGKITPSTKETEHRIHTTAGVVYPRLEQEEMLSQIRQWEQSKQSGRLSDELVKEEIREDKPPAEALREDVLPGEDAAEAAYGQQDEEPDAAPQAENELYVQTDPDAERAETSAHDEEEAAFPFSSQDVQAPAGVVMQAEEVPEAGAQLEEEELSEANQNEPHDEDEPDAQDDGWTEQAGLPEPYEAETPTSSAIQQEQHGWEEEAVQWEMEQAAEEEADFERDEREMMTPPEAGQEAATMDEQNTDEQNTEATKVAEAVPDTEAVQEAQAQEEVREAVTKAREEVAATSVAPATAESPAYALPPLDLLNPSPPPQADDDEHTQLQQILLEETLANFNVSAQVVGIVKGPSVTRFELQPAPGVKVNKITSLVDDIKLNLAAKDIRIEAPIPGRNAIGIEVPNLSSQPVLIEKIIGSETFQKHPSPLAVALGMDIGGEPIIADIKKMPHGLIAGATGSGKSVCINSIIVSLLFKATPEQVRLLLIDPKMVELAPYNHLPHLVTPVVTEAKQATAALKWAVEEMEKRYALFVDAGVRDIDRYNQTTDDQLPYIVIVIDELADLMMVSPQDVEDCIIRIAQKARACGIHLLLATQRPSVDVITGNIKANVPTRLAFAVFSQVDSRTILDQSGAERLLGRGDMLFLESGTTPVRLQGNFVSDDEIERITHMIKKQRKPSYYFSKEDLEQQVQSYDAGDDPLYLEALVFVAEQGQASASALQRRFRVGYNRAARLIEMMEADGYVSGQNGGKARAVLITPEDAQAVVEGSTLL